MNAEMSQVEPPKQSGRYFFCTLLVLIASVCLTAAIAARGEPVVVKADLQKIPMQIGEYKAIPGDLPSSVVKELNADAYLVRTYFGPQDRQIELYIGYYGTAKGGRTGHNPHACLPGAGWGILQSDPVEIEMPTDGKTVKVLSILASRSDRKEMMLYWYQSNRAQVLIPGIEQNLQKFLGKLIRNRNDGADVQVTMPFQESDLAQATADLKQFSGTIISFLAKNWPSET